MFLARSWGGKWVPPYSLNSQTIQLTPSLGAFHLVKVLSILEGRREGYHESVEFFSLSPRLPWLGLLKSTLLPGAVGGNSVE